MKLITPLNITVVVLLAAGVVAWALFSPTTEVDYSTQVKPILNKNCIACHGGVKKQAGFSVLFRDEALAVTESGKRAIIPGDPEGSEMIRRINLKDPEERMPYKHAPLSKEDISILTRWVKQGAKWGEHWAYVPVKKIAVPDVENDWVKNDIDKFIYAKLDQQHLIPAAQADKATLLRRVSLDLIGMLPSPKLAQQFLTGKDSNQSYNVLVDSLLASPHFGERWTAMWLDLARYADTKGYESDGGRNIWKYRDWVINAFNTDKPYNVFITEQIAGDLLPNPDDASFIATAYHRNTMTNDEGGTDNEEFRTAAVLDRVNNTWESFMGTTFACVQCHSHPYDPFKHDDYYKFLAYFNNTRDEDVDTEYPVLKQFDAAQKQQLETLTAWIQKTDGPEQAKNAALFLRTGQPAIYSTSADQMNNAVIGNNNIALYFRDKASARFKQVDLKGVNQLIYRYASSVKGGMMRMTKDSVNGAVIASWKVKDDKNYQNVAIDFPLQTGVHDVYLSYTNPQLKEKDRFVVFFDWFRFGTQLFDKAIPEAGEQEKTFYTLLESRPPSTPVMVENPAGMRRKTFVFERGAWTSKGKEVEPGIPEIMKGAMPAGAPANRLGLAMWLTDKKNPLVSRTIVNRLWEQLFGTGIVETLEDMGSQGMTPTHPELLDHLSWKLMNEHQWSLKRLIKEMVMSAAYRQDSKLTEEGKEKDPFNKFYARASRVRLSAEQLRDQHLCVSGSLNPALYGPSVMPWQPDGIWLSPYNSSKWQSSTDSAQYRRAVYTYWKRTAPYPSMIAFDGAQRVMCMARRIRTNTPLQALVTLNDSAYVDMARHFAKRMEKEAGKDFRKQIASGYQLMLYRPMPVEKLAVFTNLYQTALKEFNKDAAKTNEMTGMNTGQATPAFASLVVVANALLNLDEVVMRN
ncbi:MAG: DUF1553 domain-containing protein [Ferruginibacter sp.]|nr:DUF1553 domain-containing protein [Ferruginibacter sp.]